MKKLKHLLFVFLFCMSFSFGQDVKVKELSQTKFRIHHKFEGPESQRQAYELRLNNLSTVSSVEIQKKYIIIEFNIGEPRNNIEESILFYSQIFGYNSITIK